jgi:NAD(P)H-hydrate epimerase
MKPPRPLTRQEVREVDRLAIEQYGMPGVVLMENAGRGTAQHVIAALGGSVEGRTITIACGGGNNGGDGFVIARHLHNAGAEVTILLAANPEQLKGEADVTYRIARAMDLPIVPCQTAEQAQQAAGPLLRSDCIVDALWGTGFAGEVRSPLKELIEQINTIALHGIKVVAVDIPSGLDCDTGRPGGVAVRASLTATFVAPKVGMLADTAASYVGHVAVVDIGVPKEIVPR